MVHDLRNVIRIINYNCPARCTVISANLWDVGYKIEHISDDVQSFSAIFLYYARRQHIQKHTIKTNTNDKLN